tara:strand:- start:16888 stop:17571 length:684 start_codon:yes stop_codon:yes gene_type:complete
MHNHNPLQVLLGDMHRAGLTDVVSDMPFDFTNGKIRAPFEVPSSPMPISVPDPVQLPQEKNVQKEIKSQSAEKTSESRSVDDLLWSFGEKNSKVQVVLSSSLDKGVNPLSESAKILFVKMLAAIGIEEDKITYFVFSNAGSFNKAETKTALHALENRGESGRLIFVGEEATKLTFGAGILKTRLNQNEFAGKKCGVLMHPDSLLAQPLLKKIAWQDLLKFKEILGER